MNRRSMPSSGIALVTGGASSVGQACTRRLADKGFDVNSVDLKPGGSPSPAPIEERQVGATDEAAL